MDPYLHHLVLDRLLADTKLDDARRDLVLAACDGSEALEATLSGSATHSRSEVAQPELPSHPPGVYLRSISVTGFRGVGPTAVLELTPGPGLTLIVGRNGSGKSSFAEGLELLMTGANLRWPKRTKIWREGWQRLLPREVAAPRGAPEEAPPHRVYRCRLCRRGSAYRHGRRHRRPRDGGTPGRSTAKHRVALPAPLSVDAQTRDRSRPGPLQALATQRGRGVAIEAPKSARANMTSDHLTVDPRSAEIVAGDISGGPNTSHTIVVGALTALLDVVPVAAPPAAYGQAALDANVLGKDTDGARRRTFRYLRELYLLRPDSLLFRALRDLWPVDPEARPLLAGLCAVARDAVFRASSAAITSTSPGDTLVSADLADAVGEHFPASYNAGTLAKIGRNTFSSWEQTGHLADAGRSTKVRSRAACRPADVTYALLLGHLEGVRGHALFDTLWARVLDQPTSHLFDLAASASRQGMLELRQAGGVVDVGFRELLRPFPPAGRGHAR